MFTYPDEQFAKNDSCSSVTQNLVVLNIFCKYSKRPPVNIAYPFIKPLVRQFTSKEQDNFFAGILFYL